MTTARHSWTATLTIGAALTLTTWMAASQAADRIEQRRTADTSATITLLDFTALYDRQSAFVIDVRDRTSFQHGHIARAVHVPLDEIADNTSMIATSAAGRLVVTYCACASEASSLLAARTLNERGVPAKALVGGYRRWVEAGGRVE